MVHVDQGQCWVYPDERTGNSFRISVSSPSVGQRMITDQIEAALIDLMREVALAEIMPRYRGLESGDIARKTSMSDLVTIADRKSEQRISAGLAGILPGAGIVGEEAVSDDPDVLKRIADGGMKVIVDPIDGTWNFAKGLPLFGIILAVVSDSETVFGALYDPVMDEVTVAHKGRGAFHINRMGSRRSVRLAATGQSDLSEICGVVPLFLFPEPQRTVMASRLAAFDRVMSYRCSCHEYRILAEGSLDFSMSGQLKPWDHAAGELIYREAGGFAAMMATEESYLPIMITGQLLLARTRDMWRRIRDQLAGGDTLRA